MITDGANDFELHETKKSVIIGVIREINISNSHRLHRSTLIQPHFYKDFKYSTRSAFSLLDKFNLL